MKKSLMFACLCLFAAQDASGATVKATYTGTIFGSQDLSGFFHGTTVNPKANDGKIFVLDFNLDTSLGARDTVSSISDRLFGGPSFHFPSPLILATLTIEGLSQEVKLGADAEVYAGSSTYRTYAEDRTVVSFVDPDLSDGDFSFDYNSIYRGINPFVESPALEYRVRSLEKPFSVLSDFGVSGGGFQFSELECPDYSTGTSDCFFTRLAVGRLAIHRLDVTVDGKSGPLLAPVPLPASVWFMLAGFAFLMPIRRLAQR